MHEYLCDEWKNIVNLELIPVIDDSKNRVVPDKQDIWTAFNLCKPQDLKVVIIGQDPYHTVTKDGKCVADGMSFSQNHKDKASYSLKSIFNEIERDLNIKNANPKLDNWASQGVLLLNTALTTYGGVAGAHCKLWKPFIEDLMKKLVDINPIFVIWGNNAKEMLKFTREETHVLVAGHPSPLNRSIPFIGCGHFSEINRRLVSMNSCEIDWST